MKFLLFLSAVLIMAISSGCVSRTAVTTDGRECKALSDDQITYLVVMTRNAVKKNAKKHNISDRELAFVMRTKPDIQIKYRGDCFGTLLIYWRTPARRIGMRIEDHFNAFPPSCAMIIGSNNGEITTGVKPDKSRRGR